MSAQLRRIGKSLLGYIKPIRVAAPHAEPRLPEDPRLISATLDAISPVDEKLPDNVVPLHSDAGPGNDDTSQNAAPSAEHSSAPISDLADVAAAIVDALPQGEAQPTQSETPALDNKEAAHWLNLVTYLLTVCRKLSLRMDQSRGVETYQKAARGASSFLAEAVVGSIVDTLPEEEKQKRAA